RQVVATLEFSHSVDHADFEKHVVVSMIGGSNVFPDKSAPFFNVTYGLHDRTAYVRTVPLVLPEREDFMKLALSKDVATTQGGAHLANDIEDKVRVPDIYSFFKIDGAKGGVVRNADGDPEQILFVSTTAAARSDELGKALHVYLLPKKEAQKDDENIAEPTPENESEDSDDDSTESTSSDSGSGWQ